MSLTALRNLNRYGTAVLVGIALAVALPVVGGVGYLPYAGLAVLAAGFSASLALRGTRSDGDASESSDDDRREKEVKLESGGFGGNGGGV